MKKSAGRNTKLTVEEVRKVIKMFKENEKPMGNISFSDIFRYSDKLYTEGIISSAPSYSFWRKDGRLGRMEVDKANEIFSETVTISKGKEIKVPNVVDLVNKKYKDKEDLLKHLIFMEKQFHESLDRERKLQSKISDLEGTIQKTKNELNEANEKNEKLQGLVYRLYRTLSEKPNEEVKRQTEYALKTVFSSPTEFLEFEERNKTIEDSKVIPFEMNDPKTRFSNHFRK